MGESRDMVEAEPVLHLNSTPGQLRFASIPAHSVRADFAGGGWARSLRARSSSVTQAPSVLS